MDNSLKESLVTFRSSQGLELRGSLLRLSRYQVAFEVYNPNGILSLSEVLSDFRIVIHERAVYCGRAVVASLVNAGTMVVCQANLEETNFSVSSFSPAAAETRVQNGFEEFLGQWQQVYKVRPDFKVVVADMQTFLMDLRLWLEQMELEIRSAPTGNRLELEQKAVAEIGAAMVPCFDAMHERLEALSEEIEGDLRPVHQNFSKRQLHPLVLCSPFAYRTYHKPLGYAGDYEMVNMIWRDPYEGASMFAKVVNVWFLSQWPAKAHRNRINQLKTYLRQECLRASRRGVPLRILNLGCGPAREVQEFLAEDGLSDWAQFTLLDFNEETIQHTSRVLDDLKKRYARRAQIQLQKKSVHQMLKEGSKPIVNAAGKNFDFIYCAGLFDYLADRTCKQLMGIFYDWLAPGGLVAATNVDNCKPFRNMLEFVLDWHLISRDEKKAAALLPDRISQEQRSIRRDSTRVNLFIEVRKPDHA